MKREEGEKLRRRREAYGVSLRQLAAVSGIAASNLSAIEHGRRGISSEKFKELLKALERLNPNVPFDIFIDYVRIRFPTEDVEEVLHDVLRLKKERMIFEKWGVWGYRETYLLGDIRLMAGSENVGSGVLLELRGSGCRQMEAFLIAQERTWYDFFLRVISKEGVLRRLDFALNDRAGILDIPWMKEKCEREESISLFRTFEFYRAGELKREEKGGMGNTLYIGSKKSDIYFCIYEKDYEQYIKLGIPMEEADVKNRFEVRLRDDRALRAVEHLLSFRDAYKTVYGMIRHYLRFVEPEEGVERRYWKNSHLWDLFLYGYEEDVKLTMCPQPYTLDKTKQWIAKQVAPSLKLLMTLDEAKGVGETWETIVHARLTKKQKQMIAQQMEVYEDLGSACVE